MFEATWAKLLIEFTMTGVVVWYVVVHSPRQVKQMMKDFKEALGEERTNTHEIVASIEKLSRLIYGLLLRVTSASPDEVEKVFGNRDETKCPVCFRSFAAECEKTCALAQRPKVEVSK